MAIMIPCGTPKHSTVTNLSQSPFTSLSRSLYIYCCNVDSFISQTTGAGAASAADGNIFVPAGTIFPIHGDQGDTLNVIRSGGVSGDCSLTPVRVE